VRVRPFLGLRGSLLVHDKIADQALQRARAAFEEKLAFFGGQLATARPVAGSPEALAAAIRDERRAGMRLLVVAGSRSMDPRDPVLRALDLAGARLERHGVPAYPGTLLWIAYLDDVPVVGAPSCGIFSRATSLDVVLPRLMAGDRMDAAAIADLSAGGLLAPETSWRLAPYRAGVPRGQLE
jgi:molybdopterin biosynthesis enzyme